MACYYQWASLRCFLENLFPSILHKQLKNVCRIQRQTFLCLCFWPWLDSKLRQRLTLMFFDFTACVEFLLFVRKSHKPLHKKVYRWMKDFFLICSFACFDSVCRIRSHFLSLDQHLKEKFIGNDFIDARILNILIF